jgi:hypothetical protein
MSKIVIDWNGGLAMQGQSDMERPVKVCPEESEFFCIAVGATLINFAFPRRLDAIKWTFMGRFFRIIDSVRSEGESVWLVQSMPIHADERASFYTDVESLVYFWYSATQGLLAYQYRTKPGQGTAETQTYFAGDTGVLIAGRDKSVPPESVFSQSELSSAFSDQASLNIEEVLIFDSLE